MKDIARYRFVLGLAVPALLLVWWEMQARGGGASAAFAPLGQVAGTFVEEARDGQMLANCLATLQRALSGFTLGAGAGVMLGVAMALSRPVETIIGPLFHALRQVPLLGWLPLVGLWLGNGEGAKLLIISLGAFYPAVLNSFTGISGVERRYQEVTSVLRFSGGQRFFRLLLPAAAPTILTGISQSLAFAWIGTIGSELLLGTGSGLGSALSVGQMQQRMDIVLVAIALTGALGLMLNTGLLRVRRQLLRWQPSL